VHKELNRRVNEEWTIQRHSKHLQKTQNDDKQNRKHNTKKKLSGWTKWTPQKSRGESRCS